jgi:predicted DNA-binding helix-hairpin-helix protein
MGLIQYNCSSNEPVTLTLQNTMMDTLQRLKLLSSDMSLEPAEDTGCPRLDAASNRSDKLVLSQAVLPNGKRIQLLKSLLTSACERNCYYCPFRAGRDYRRATFKPDEFAQAFMNLHNAGIVQGAFISSGIVGGSVRTQDKLLDIATLLRTRYAYQGYLHLKIMPGAERDQVEQAMRLTDRVSINLEAPNTERLRLLAPNKEFTEELLQPLRWVEEIRRNQPRHHGWNGHWPSSTTQFVVGGAGESDLELISVSQQLYKHMRLSRVYYSAFNPIPDTPLENLPAVSATREHRLYQASFLLRDYGFDTEDLPFDPATGNLPQYTDPKLAWANEHLAHSPVEINRANRHALLRVPGIGPKGVRAILASRRQQMFRDLSNLHKLGIDTQRAAPFILLDGKRPAYQPALF